MAVHRDPWVLLGLERSADDALIKKAYRRLARENHPDRNQGDESKSARFQEIARAYEVIKTEEKRDEWLVKHEGMSSNTFGSLGEDFYETFGDEASFPAGGQSDLRRDAPKDVHKAITVSFREAYAGTQQELVLDLEEACPTCGGSGAAPGHKPRMCTICRGTGEHTVGRVSSPCAACTGRGFTIDYPCPRCASGVVRSTRPLLLTVPAGVRDGQTLRLPMPRVGVGSADVCVAVTVTPSRVFKRTLKDPSDLLIVVPITYTEACFGGSVKVPTPEKTIILRVPPGTQTGKAFRIPGRGMPKGMAGARGDMYARVQVVIPTDMSGPQRKLIQQLGHYDDSERLRSELFTALREN